MRLKLELFFIHDLEQYTSERLAKMARDYYNGRTLDELTLEVDIQSYKRYYYIHACVLRNSGQIDINSSPGFWENCQRSRKWLGGLR